MKIIWGGGIVIVMVLVVWLLSGGKEQNRNTNKRIPFVSSNWTKKFQLTDKNPLGLFLFTRLTQAHIDTSHSTIEVPDWIAYDSLINDKNEVATYLFVGNSFGLQTAEIDTLVARVKRGSDLFLSFNDLTENIYERLIGDTPVRFDYDDHVNVFTKSTRYSMINLFQTDTVACHWQAFGNIDDNSNIETLSSFMEMSNFIKINYGKGSFYLHTNPLMFYNYQIKRKPGFEYTSFVLDHLPNNRNIYFLELGRLTDNYGNYDIDEEDDMEGKRDDSYLQLIFKSPTLVIALLLSIAGVLLFVIFRSKRMRPVVPYIKPKKDMTMAFAETITSIYFSKRNPYGLLQVQRKNFYATVQKHFFVDLTRRENDRVLQVLAEKSDRSLTEIQSLLSALETKEASSVNDAYVADMQKRLHAFYSSTGIISSELREKIKKKEMIFKRNLWLPALLIIGGLYSIIQGMYLLAGAVGVGIALWPIGIILLLLGIIRLSNPLLIINDKQIIYYTSLGKKQVFDREHLIGAELRSGGTIFKFINNKTLIINYWDMSLFDKKQFQKLLSKLNILES